MYIYRYKIKLFNDGNESIVSGIIFGKNYKEAIEVLVFQYGEDEIQDVLCLRAMGNGALIELPNEYESIVDKLENEWLW